VNLLDKYESRLQDNNSDDWRLEQVCDQSMYCCHNVYLLCINYSNTIQYLKAIFEMLDEEEKSTGNL